MSYDIAPDQVVAMSCEQAFQERKCADAGALSWTVRVSVTDGGATVISTRRKLPTVGFPTLLRKLLPAGMTSTEVITWSPPDEVAAVSERGRAATLHVDFHGAPATLHGRIEVTPTAAGGSTVRIIADFRAEVPIVGGKVEKLASPIIVGVIESEQETGRAWLGHVA